ncbi:hypothetical protein FRB93_006087 [Tulasnella sp. JGI-2019a]|nr:hypothetical protein FRB93_006087 [Tulasnella sp. JGI-2019a]
MDLHQLNGSLSIPDELLTRIFQFTLSGFWCINRCGQENIKNGATYYDELSLLRGVCVIWRELIDSSPGFWALVESTVPNIEACLAKSRNVPITIALRLTGSNQLGLVNWERGLEVISRGETANIEYYLEEDWADAEISALKASCAPMLQEICLSDCIQRVPDRIAIDLFCLLGSTQRSRTSYPSMDHHQLNGSLGIPDDLLTRIFQFTLSGFWCINRYGWDEIKSGATYYSELSLLRSVCVVWMEVIDSSPSL